MTTKQNKTQNRITITDREAWQWARDHQGYTGDYAAWQAMSAAERAEYEDGAAGIPTA